MAKIRDFKIPLPQTFPLSASDSLQNSDLILMGDSFFNVTAGFKQFSELIKDNTNLKVHNYNIQGSGEPWRKTNPLDYLKESNFVKGTKKILLLESVDRGIKMRLLNINRPLQNPIPTPVPTTTLLNTTTPPIGSIETTTYNNGVLYLQGWGIGNNGNPSLSKINISLDKQELSGIQINQPRPDVAAFFQQPTWTHNGWSFNLPLNLKPGKHFISVTLFDTNNNRLQLQKEFNYSTFQLLQQKYQSRTSAYNELIKQKMKTFDYLLQENIINSSCAELISTLRFHALRQTSPLTPKYSLNPKMLFYKDEVDFYQNPPTAEETQKIADNLKYISEQLKSQYNVDLIFVPMPTKYTIYHKLAKENSDSPFFPSLFQELDKRKVKYIDLYHPFKNSNEILYLPSDTHWNQKGAEIGVKETLKTIIRF